MSKLTPKPMTAEDIRKEFSEARRMIVEADRFVRKNHGKHAARFLETKHVQPQSEPLDPPMGA